MTILSPAAGPADPPSSRPFAGVLRAEVIEFEFVPADGVTRVTLNEVVVRQGDILRWAFYADGDDAALAPFAALAVAVDVVAGDGSRLSDDARVQDRYGFAIDAEAQFAARWSFPEQWNENAVSLDSLAGTRVEIDLVLGSATLHGSAPVTGFVQVSVEEASPVGDEPADLVDTRRGTHSGDRFSRGNTIPAVAVPHGFLFLTPATNAADSRWPYRPYVHDEEQGRRLEAIQFSHQPSPWIGDRGVLQLMPFGGVPDSDYEARRRFIRPDTEQARPYVWSADLGDGLVVRATATNHVGAFDVSSSGDAPIGFVLDQLTGDGSLRFIDDEHFEGWVPAGDTHWGNPPRTYFAGRVVGSAANGHLSDAGRERVAGFVEGRGRVEVRIALSFLSIETARQSLDREAGAERSFDELQSAARDAWNQVCSTVTTAPLAAEDAPFRGLPDAEQRATIASSLYRLHLYPNTASEIVDGFEQPLYADPFAAVMQPESLARDESLAGAGDLMVNNGYWDTYRTVYAAHSLLNPDHTAHLLDGLLEQYRRGGYMARWSAPGYVDSMVGTSSDQIFADAERWGVSLDEENAFASAWRNACEPSPTPLAGRKGIDRGRFVGYIDRSTHEGLSWSIENAISDAAIGHWASRLSDRTDDPARWHAFARYFANRSLSYRHLFDAASGFFRGRDEDGSFPAEPLNPNEWGGDYVETNAWGLSVSAVHDGWGLADLYGGPTGLGEHLDRLMATPETADPANGGWYRTVIHEQREARALRAGMCAISNQPAHHIPYMYAFTDRPWRAGEVVHDLAKRLFGGAHIAQGFPGDEDNGEMSAWWLWALLGLYPLELASGVLHVARPLHPQVSLTRADGSALSVQTHGDGSVLTRVEIDGVSQAEPVIPVDALRGSARIDLTYGADTAHALRFTPRTTARYRADLVPPTHPVGSSVRLPRSPFDDGASTEAIVVGAGDWIGVEFAQPVLITDVTVTVAEPVSSSALLWEVRDGAGVWHDLTTTHDERLLANRTTPFQLTSAPPAAAIRVRALGAVAVQQLELFDLS